MSDYEDVRPFGNFIKAQRSFFCKTKGGDDVYLYTVLETGVDVDACDVDDELLLVPDAITVVMPWDEDEHIFHDSQLMAYKPD